MNKLGFRLILYTSTYTTTYTTDTTENTTANNNNNNTNNKQDNNNTNTNNNIHIKNSKIRIYINNIICNKQNSYNINITHEYIILYAYDIIGILYGLQTLTQIIELHSEIMTKHATTNTTTYSTTNNSINNMYNIPYISIYIPSITIQDHPDTYVYRSVLWSETQFFKTANPIFYSNLKLLLKCRINMILLKIKPNTIYNINNTNTITITTNTTTSNNTSNISSNKERIEMCNKKYIQIVPSYTYTSPYEVYTPYTPLIHTTNNNNNSDNNNEKCSMSDLIALHFLYDIANINKAHTLSTTTTANHTTNNNTSNSNSTHQSTAAAAAAAAAVGVVEAEIEPVDSTTYEHDCLHACHAVLVGVKRAGYRSVLMYTNEWTRRVAGPYVSGMYIYICVYNL